MIVSVPSAPVLLPGLTGLPVPEVEQLRAACLLALQALLAQSPTEVVVLGAAAPVWSAGTPLSQLVAQALLDEAGFAVALKHCSIDPDATPADCRALGRSLAGQSLVVVADGSARRGVKAPGYLNQRAAPFDAALQAALDSADPAALAGLDAALAAELMVGGRAPWQVMAGAAEDRAWTARTYYADAPFGVWYPVVSWQ